VSVRTAILGVGVVSPIGAGADTYWEGLLTGADGVSAIDRFDCTPLRARLGAQIQATTFDAGELLGRKGLKYVDRLSQFALAATQLALQHAQVDLDQFDPHDRAVVLGTAFGSLSSQQDLNRERILDGPSWVSPMKFPNTPINALSYQIPIRHQMRLANVTIPAGTTSSLEAVRYSMSLFGRNPGAVVLCGGAEELSFLNYYSAAFRDELAGVTGEEASRPFDRRRNGYIFGEGAAVLVLQRAERAPRAMALIEGYGRSFASLDAGDDGWIAAIETSMRAALQAAGRRPDAVDLVLASANSSLRGDAYEAQALARVFGPAGVPVSATKALLGETFGASGALQMAAAVLAVDRGTVPPSFHTGQIDPACPVRLVEPPARPGRVRCVLVNSVDGFGGVASVVVARPEGASTGETS
jgi:3-oxoacyl-[acyl-carrier-protein] synthase II